MKRFTQCSTALKIYRGVILYSRFCVNYTKKPQEIKYVKNCPARRRKKNKKLNYEVVISNILEPEKVSYEFYFGNAQSLKLSHYCCTITVTLFIIVTLQLYTICNNYQEERIGNYEGMHLENIYLYCAICFLVRNEIQRKISVIKVARILIWFFIETLRSNDINQFFYLREFIEFNCIFTDGNFFAVKKQTTWMSTRS